MSVGDSTERWVEIKDHPNYEVSSHGRVRRSRPGINTAVGKILLQHPDDKGYPRVGLSMSGNRVRWKRVHRMVVDAFIRPMVGKEQVNHRDGNKTNNLLENLEITDNRGNQIHAHRTGLQPTRANGRKSAWRELSPEVVRLVRSMSRDGSTPKQIMAHLGLSQAPVYGILSGRSYRHIQ